MTSRCVTAALSRLARYSRPSASIARSRPTALSCCPGLIQTRIHLCQTLFRGYADDLALLDWSRTRVWPMEAAHTPASLAAAARQADSELLMSGTTTVLTMETAHDTDSVFAAPTAACGRRSRRASRCRARRPCSRVDDHEQSVMAEHDVKILHCPGSNLKLGSGLAPIVEMRAKGISISLGADGAACNDHLDMFEEMRTVPSSSPAMSPTQRWSTQPAAAMSAPPSWTARSWSISSAQPAGIRP